ncbi:nuclear transport factor 2 family protein [Nonomuraea sp. NPDC050227]|uniref:nuclear transport factor 2 family protein n=1 Tax=unclassified Nonomuraea TaxID=2593643 RepID=UPI00331FDD93
MSDLTAERLAAAHQALRSGDRERALEYWHPDVRFQSPGNHPYAGWHDGLDAFMGFIKTWQRLAGGTLRMEQIACLVNPVDGYTIDVNRCTAVRRRTGSDGTSFYEHLQMEGVDLMRWENGRIVEGRGGIFGDGTANFSSFFGPIGPDGRRSDD